MDLVRYVAQPLPAVAAVTPAASSSGPPPWLSGRGVSCAPAAAAALRQLPLPAQAGFWKQRSARRRWKQKLRLYAEGQQQRSGHPEHEDEWDIRQVVSIASGVLGSILSTSAHSKQKQGGSSREPQRQQGGAAAAAASAHNRPRIVQQLGGALLDAETDAPLFALGPVPPCTEASDLRREGRHFTIITTASLPWLTGTAVNPLLRALALAKLGKPTSLLLPWLEEADQQGLFPKGQTFASPEAQEAVIRKWCKERGKTDTKNLPLEFRWYSAKFFPSCGSIFPTGDITRELSEKDPRDVLILEEPEHLCWYHHGPRWADLYEHVVGIVHTNYSAYAEAGEDLFRVVGTVQEGSLTVSSTVVCLAYCDVNVKLSDTIIPLPNEVTCNVHGVRDEFLYIGDRMTGRRSFDDRSASVYYIGKALYAKGWGELLDLLEAAGSELDGFRIDGYGSGPSYEGIIERAGKLKETRGALLDMHPGRDHADEGIHNYAVLVNPSTSDVLCTVTVEALAMGKRCVLARHPSNRFFENYFSSRCHFFEPDDVQGFVAAVKAACAEGPAERLPDDLRYTLTWEAACERLFDSAEVRVLSGNLERPTQTRSSRFAYKVHFDTLQEESVIADVIKSSTLAGKEWTLDSTMAPIKERYLKRWDELMNHLPKDAAKQLQEFAEKPDHIKESEEYLKEKMLPIRERMKRLLKVSDFIGK
eukprot:TRINITY_DN29540_c0_g1_i1.p1 TRINITY_DN29540_c0_g1~~TRINITY_DN29540_c0_g1_i1.p1  ORF type:complete len:702 (+),score=205.26 TRINITY_DN29540_c0_g1_i1:136-2241(+)